MTAYVIGQMHIHSHDWMDEYFAKIPTVVSATDSFLQAILDYQPQLVWLSVSTISDIPSFVAEQNRLAEHISDDVSLLVGGRALSPEIRPQLRYTAHCDGLRNLVDLAGMIRPIGGR